MGRGIFIGKILLRTCLFLLVEICLTLTHIYKVMCLQVKVPPGLFFMFLEIEFLFLEPISITFFINLNSSVPLLYKEFSLPNGSECLCSFMKPLK